MTENRNSQSIEGSFHKHGGDHALPEAEEKSKKANNKDKTTNILKTHHFFWKKSKSELFFIEMKIYKAM